MAKRQTKRTVRIRYVGRDPDDPLSLLEAVEQVFRPRVIEIEVSADSASETAETSLADEPLETRVREKVGELLDARDATAAQRTESSSPDGLIEKRGRIRSWIANRIAAGWQVLVKILPTLKHVKDLLE